MTSPTVKLHFDPTVDDEDATYLSISDVDGGTIVSWSDIGESVFVPEHKWWPDLAAMEAANGGKFTLHGNLGYSLGRFHELCIEHSIPTEFGVETAMISAEMGNVEVTFGVATPLMAHLFEGVIDKHLKPWSELATVRILGAPHGAAEVAFFNACRIHFQLTGFWPKLMTLDLDWDETEEVGELEHLSAPPMCTDVEPLRFLNSAMNQRDDTAACVSLYRVVEYFSFRENATAMGTLRHDATLSDADFSKKVLDLVFKDEKGPIFKTVKTLADAPLLTWSASQGLVIAPVASQLAEALYSFRNAIVHGKHSSGFLLHSESVLDPNPLSAKWRHVLLQLASKAIVHYGSN